MSKSNLGNNAKVRSFQEWITSTKSRLTEKNGHPESYRVKYWGVGNENYGEWQVGYRSAKDYAKVLREYARFMKVVDPNIKVVAVGADDPEWDLEVVKTAGNYIDYISNHQYLGSDDYYETVASVYWVKRRLEVLKSVIETAQPLAKEEERVKIALDEWNIQKSIFSEVQYSLVSEKLKIRPEGGEKVGRLLARVKEGFPIREVSKD